MKAFSITNAKVYVYSHPVSMSNSFRGLRDLIVTKLRRKPDEGELFLFVNKAKNFLKVYWFNNEGPCIFAKKLANRFFEVTDLPKSMTVNDLQHLVDHVTKECVEDIRKAA